MAYLFLLIPFLIAVAAAVWFVARHLDEFRIREQVESRGGKLLEQHRTSSQAGGGPSVARTYEVRYRDVDGLIHRATVHTGLFRPVTWGEDQIIGTAE